MTEHLVGEEKQKGRERERKEGKRREGGEKEKREGKGGKRGDCADGDGGGGHSGPAPGGQGPNASIVGVLSSSLSFAALTLRAAR